MKQNIYDDPQFFEGYSKMRRHETGLNAAIDQPAMRSVLPPLAGKEDWEVTCDLARALGYPMEYAHPSAIMDEIARLTPTFEGISYAKLERIGSAQWPCNGQAPEGTPVMHVGEFVRGKRRPIGPLP